MKTKIFLTIAFTLLNLSFISQSAQASDYSLSITPPLLRVHIKPGKTITQVFKIDNTGSSEKTLVANIVPFTEADTSGNPVLNPKSQASWLEYFSLANSKIKFGEPFIIQAGGTEQLIIALSVPENAPLKDIYATLTVSTYTNAIDSKLQGTSVSATIGSNMLITISSQPFPDTVLRVEDFSPQQGSFIKIGNLYLADSITPLTFTALVKNDGMFTAETKGVFRITNTRNKPVFLEGILPVNVIAKSQRQLTNTDGQPFSFSPSLTQVGLHHITLEIKTDNSNSSGSINIFFFPLKLMLGIIAAVMIISLTVRFSSFPSNNPIDKDNDS